MNNRNKKQPQLFKIDDKSVVGSYLNVARANFYKTMLHIFASVGIKGIYDEEKIMHVLDALFKILSGKVTELTREQNDWSKHLRLRNEQMVKMQQLLFRHLPMLGPIMADIASYKVYKNKKSNVINDDELMRGVSLVECMEVVSLMAACLSDCRNYYTHFNPYNSNEELVKQYKRQEKVAGWLEKVFVASRRIDKKRNCITASEMEFLTGTDHYFQKKKIDEEGKPVIKKNKNGEPIINKRTGEYIYEMTFIERDEYYFKISGTKTVPGTNNHSDKIVVLSDFGVIYFCSLFLSKTHIKLLVEQTKLFADGKSPFTEKENNIVREMLGIYRIRTPKGRRLDSKDSKTLLAMDMINELRKCPMQLYDVLSLEGKAFFEDKVVHENEQTQDVSKRLRYTDRFPHLVMRYIDQNELFRRIRFQVRLGHFRFNFYDKVSIDGKDDVRAWQKEINGYGRLQEIEEKRLKKYQNILQKSEIVSTKLENEELYLDMTRFVEDKPNSQPYITDHKASYNIHNNRIGLFWDDESQQFFEGSGMYLPDLVVEGKKAPVKMHAPKAMLSVFDMPAMMFYQYLLENTIGRSDEFPKIEEIIIKKYNQLKRFFLDVSNETIKPYKNRVKFKEALDELNLSMNEIPDKLVEYLSSEGVKPVHERLKSSTTEQLKKRLEYLKRRRDNYEKDRNMVGNKDNKYAKDSYVDVRHGKLAQFLAESIVDWLSKDSEALKIKLTGMNYNRMQAFLATYGVVSTFDELKKMFQSACLIDNNNAHPFLNEVLKPHPQNIEVFYKEYIKKEIAHLESFFKKGSNGNINELKEPIDYAKLPFIHHDREKWKTRNMEFYKKLAARYLTIDDKECSIMLHDGLFTPYILKILRAKYADNKALQKQLNDDKLVNNASYLINTFFNSVLNDQSQPFYLTSKIEEHTNKEIPNEFARNYELFNILNNKKEGNTLLPIFLTSNEINHRLKDKVCDEDNNPKPIFGKRGKPQTDTQGNPLYIKAIEQEIDSFVNKMGCKDCGNHPTLDEAKEAMGRKLRHLISKVKDNERTIRRFKTQDMVLFLMAKKMFFEIMGSQKNTTVNEDLFKLPNVCDENFLSQTMRMEYPVKVDDREVNVVQENMSLKNYGEFYRFLYDDRLTTLLKQLNDINTVNYSELTGEFSSYDQKRAILFEAMQEFEKLAFEAFKDDLQNPDSDIFCHNNKPRRNNFRSLIDLLSSVKGANFDENIRNRLVEIRNAFCHNTFKIELKDEQKTLPTITIKLIEEIDRILKSQSE